MRGRAAAAIALVVLAGILLAYGGALLYVKQELGREKPFAARVVSALDDPDVRGVVTERTVDALEAGPASDLLPFRPVVLAAVDALVRSSSFKRIATFGIADAHRALVTENSSVIVELEGAGRQLVSMLRSVSPAVARRTSGDVRPLLTRVNRDNTVLRIVRGLVHKSRWAWAALVLALLAAAGALAVARNRRRAAVNLGAAMASAGVFVAAVVWLGGRVVAGYVSRATRLDSERDRHALDAVWQALFGDLGSAALSVAVGGLLLAAVAGVSSPAGSLLRAREWSRSLALPRPLRVAAALIAVLACLLAPGAVVRVVVLVLGAALVVWALAEAAAAIQARLPARSGRSPGSRSAPGLRRSAVTAAAAAAVAASLAIAVAIALDVPPVPAVVAAPSLGCNGSRALCTRRLNEVVWPATHNSYAASDQRGWYFANQRRDIAKQLEDGVTGFLIDVHWGVLDPKSGRVRTDLRAEGSDRNKVVRQLDPRALRVARRIGGNIGTGLPPGQSSLYLCHTLCEIGAEPLGQELAAIRHHLERDRGAVLMIVVEDYVRPARIRAALDQAGLLGYAASLDRARPLPTLGELVRSGRRLVIFAEKDGGAYPWYMPAFSFIQDTPLGNKRPGDFTCKRARGDADSPILLLNNWIDRFPPRPSDNGPVGTNAFLTQRIGRCGRERGIRPGLVAVDFYERSSVVKLARELNR
jgi:hypothetical protein